jgi:hypothetical protein
MPVTNYSGIQIAEEQGNILHRPTTHDQVNKVANPLLELPYLEANSVPNNMYEGGVILHKIVSISSIESKFSSRASTYQRAVIPRGFWISSHPHNFVDG